MTRLASALDRVAALIAGVAMIALGVILLAWNTSRWPVGVPTTIALPGVRAATDAGWWSWALAGAGVVLVVVALRWLLIHTPAARVKTMPVPAGDVGSVTIDLGDVASAAAQALQGVHGVESARGRAIVDRGTRTVDLHVTVAPSARPDLVVAGIDGTCAQIATMLTDPSVATRTTVHTAKRLRPKRVR